MPKAKKWCWGVDDESGMMFVAAPGDKEPLCWSPMQCPYDSKRYDVAACFLEAICDRLNGEKDGVK